MRILFAHESFCRFRFKGAVCWLALFVVNGILLVEGLPLTGQETKLEQNRRAQGFLTSHCAQCHNGTSDDTEFRVDELKRVSTATLSRWKEVAERVKAREMPPHDFRRQPTASARGKFNQWLDDSIRQIEMLQLRDKSPVQYKRLTQVEYVNTIENLLGVRISPAELTLCEDNDWQGIERIGSRQMMSATHMERYIEAAESIVDEAFQDSERNPTSLKFGAIELVGGDTKYGSEVVEQLRENPRSMPRVDLWPGQSIRTPQLADRAAGQYRFRIQLSGLKNENNNGPPHLTVVDSLTGRLLYERDVIEPESSPVQLEFHAHLGVGSTRILVSNQVNGPLILMRLGRSTKPFYSLAEGYLPWQVDFLTAKELPNYACLIVDSIEIEGPIVAPEIRQLRSRLIPASASTDDIQSCLKQFLTRAFRRPVEQKELDRYSDFALAEIKSGSSIKQAMKSVLVAILCSRDFLYLVEGSTRRTSNQLNDWELATRLSYFLWSSMPDDELFEIARQGRLQDHATLTKQFRRMMSDRKAKRFAKNFARQWLLLDQVGQFKPNAKLYPEYDPYLERSMVEESTRFFEKMFSENRPLTEFIQSDWTILNPRLARHYGIQLSDNDEEAIFRTVELAKTDHRGGILTQAAILSLTSDGLRTRPVHRGVWMYEQFLGRSIPSPPQNVEAIEPVADSRPKLTFRQQLAAHVSNPNCATCHRKIDPLGFAFENYDAIGRWRTTELTATGIGDLPPVDASGTLPDGRSFDNAQQFQQLIMADIDEFQRALIRKLAAYGTRRVMTSADEGEIDDIASKSATAGYRLSHLIELLVLSNLFKRM